MKKNTAIKILSESRVKGIEAAVEALSKRAVYVGISKNSAPRTDGCTLRNSELGWIHEKGSVSQNIPPRPFLVPGINKAKPAIVAGYREALENALHGEGENTVEDVLYKIGDRAASGVKNYIRTAYFIPLRPSTIANRYRARENEHQRWEEFWMDQDNIRPLQNTGALLKSIDSYLGDEHGNYGR